ncbi:hypothetical protein AURDEDRAFT_130878 [Auricularia subglabra TFB-10046 SS5]|nr:hypothetical protein AURDEDRAFT_130878 [Auricularia subglabra TFB-10046 SS5]
MSEFLEKQTFPFIACRCTISACGKMHAPSIAADGDHALYQEAGYCPVFNTVVGYYDRASDQYHSVFANRPRGGHRVGAHRQPRRASVQCEIGDVGCRGDGARACVNNACKACCSKAGAYCNIHDPPRRPAAAQAPRRHGLLNLSLSIRDLKTSRFTNLVVPSNVFHLALLEREQFKELAFDELDAKSLQYYDLTELSWRPLEQQTAITLLPTTRTLILRASSRLQCFPPRYVCDFSDSYDQFCSLIGPETSQAVAFKKAFPDYRFDADEFRAALDDWSSTPHDVQTVFKEAGRSEAGLWVDLVKDAARRRHVLAARRRRSTLQPPVAKVVKHEIIEIEDDD